MYQQSYKQTRSPGSDEKRSEEVSNAYTTSQPDSQKDRKIVEGSVQDSAAPKAISPSSTPELAHITQWPSRHQKEDLRDVAQKERDQLGSLGDSSRFQDENPSASRKKIVKHPTSPGTSSMAGSALPRSRLPLKSPCAVPARKSKPSKMEDVQQPVRKSASTPTTQSGVIRENGVTILCVKGVRGNKGSTTPSLRAGRVLTSSIASTKVQPMPSRNVQPRQRMSQNGDSRDELDGHVSSKLPQRSNHARDDKSATLLPSARGPTRTKALCPAHSTSRTAGTRLQPETPTSTSSRMKSLEAFPAATFIRPRDPTRTTLALQVPCGVDNPASTSRPTRSSLFTPTASSLARAKTRDGVESTDQ